MRCLTTILINLIVVIVLLAGIEFYFRLAPAGESAPGVRGGGLWLYVVPYMGFSARPHSHYSSWINTFTNEVIPANVTTNNHGYNDRHDFSFTEPYRKAENERVVLFTGGSTGWGTGSRSVETTVSGRMEYHLNSLQKDLKYTVINLAMGSWIAYQEFLGLEMWGASFQPDWVVVMDGHNDASVGCAYSQGVMNPLYFPLIKSYVDAYLSGTGRPVFYRGWLENEVIKRSVAYRRLTGKSYIRNPLVYDESNKERDEYRKAIIPTKLGEARQMLAFYLKAQEAILKLYPTAGYILSTQPMTNRFSGEFTDVYDNMEDAEAHRAAATNRADDLEIYLSAHADEPCNTVTYVPSFVYIYVKGAIELERLADRVRAQGRLVEYHNMGRLFPDDHASRLPYFIDPAHLSDKGADVLGKFYAERILRAGRR